MELIPASAEVLRELNLTSRFDLTVEIQQLAGEIEKIVPSCVGVSVTVAKDAMTFTLVASSEVAESLDATQYEAGGPCVEAVQLGDEQVVDDALSESRWQAYARAAAASNVRSSLALPLVNHDRLSGSLNIYAADPHAFAGTNPRLRQLVGSPAGALITNADLEFTTRDRADDAPRLLEESDVVNQAIGILVGTHQIDARQAEERLHEQADQAGLTLLETARGVLAGRYRE